ncbi:tektin-2 isoform X3 [Pithys albifrons albifrons]|uniref:tektin-2 isoform X3 n=1 Tax=Pithys albifrons albifrons TaxID=3385563 RepID=UPI003A5D0F6C
MASLSVKPGQRFTLPDWQNNSHLISANAEHQRSTSHQIRQEARALRNHTGNQAKWDECDSRTRLKDRITSVDRWREVLARCLTDIDLEIDALTKVKEAAEDALQAKNLCLDVAIECLTFRESRRDIDVVRDPVEEELHREVKVIERTKKELQQRVDEAFKQLCRLKEARQQLNCDHRHKVEALELDRQCLSFNVTSGNISFKVNPTRIPDGTTALREWELNSQHNRDRAEAEMKASIELRGAITLTIAQTNNELDAQRMATEFALRKRIRDMEGALSELRWQEQNTLEEIAEMEEDIRQLEEDLRKRTLDLKVAHTRLETRTYRPHVELCRDQVPPLAQPLRETERDGGSGKRGRSTGSQGRCRRWRRRSEHSSRNGQSRRMPWMLFTDNFTASRPTLATKPIPCSWTTSAWTPGENS